MEELEAQIATFRRQNRYLEQLVRRLQMQSRASTTTRVDEQQDWKGKLLPPFGRRAAPLQHTVEILSDDELLRAIDRGSSYFNAPEECQR